MSASVAESSQQREGGSGAASFQGLDEDAKTFNLDITRTRKLRCCGIFMLCGGLSLIAIAFVIPYAIDRIVRSNVLADTRLTPENESFWSGDLAGGGAIQIYQDHYLYSCTNLDDVSNFLDKILV